MKYLYLLVILFFINSYSISGDSESMKYSKSDLPLCSENFSLIDSRGAFKYTLSLNCKEFTISKYKIGTDNMSSNLGTIHINPKEQPNPNIQIPKYLDDPLQRLVTRNLALSKYYKQLPLIKKYLVSMDKSDLFSFVGLDNEFGCTLLLNSNKFTLNIYKNKNSENNITVYVNPSDYKDRALKEVEIPKIFYSSFADTKKNIMDKNYQCQIPLIKKLILMAYKCFEREYLKKNSVNK